MKALRIFLVLAYVVAWLALVWSASATSECVTNGTAGLIRVKVRLSWSTAVNNGDDGFGLVYYCGSSYPWYECARNHQTPACIQWKSAGASCVAETDWVSAQPAGNTATFQWRYKNGNGDTLATKELTVTKSATKQVDVTWNITFGLGTGPGGANVCTSEYVSDTVDPCTPTCTTGSESNVVYKTFGAWWGPGSVARGTNVWYTKSVCTNGGWSSVTNNFSACIGTYFIQKACRDGTWQVRRQITGVQIFANGAEFIVGGPETNATSCGQAAYLAAGGTTNGWAGLSASDQASWDLTGGPPGLVIYDKWDKLNAFIQNGQTSYWGYVAGENGQVSEAFTAPITGAATGGVFVADNGTNGAAGGGVVLGEATGLDGMTSWGSSSVGSLNTNAFAGQGSAVVAGVGTITGRIGNGSINTGGNGWNTSYNPGPLSFGGDLANIGRGTSWTGLACRVDFAENGSFAKDIAGPCRQMLEICLYTLTFVACLHELSKHL